MLFQQAFGSAAKSAATVVLAAILAVSIVAMAVDASTTISTNITTGGTLSVTGASTLTGAATFAADVTLGDAAGDALTINSNSITYANAATSTIVSSNLGALAVATTSATVPFLRFDTSNSRIGIGTTSPGATFSVAGDGLYTGNLTVSGTFSSTQTSATAFTVTNLTLLNGQLQATSTALFGGAVTIYNSVLGLGNATTTAAGNISTLGTLSVTSQLQASSTALFGSNVTVYNAILGLGHATTTALGNFTTDGIIIDIGQFQASSTALFGSNVTVYNAILGLGNATTTAAGNFCTLGKICVGTSSPTTLELSAQGSATTTVAAFSSGTRVGGCIQMTGSDGTMYRMYIGAGGGVATTTPSGLSGYIAVWEAGSCK